MQRLRRFLHTATVGGAFVLLPAAVFLSLAAWLLEFGRAQLYPLTRAVARVTSASPLVAELVAFLLVLGACFVLGALVRTRTGADAYHWLEAKTLLRLPGYKAVKEVVAYFSGSRSNPFTRPVLVRVGSASLTGFLSDEGPDLCTVFVPTSPNPTTGIVMHVAADQVEPLGVPSTEAIKSILACGAGSQRIFAGGNGA